ncbi:MAG: RNA-binding domain-containing protein [Nitrososphaeraceae archaeon]
MKHNNQSGILQFLSSYIDIVVHATEDKSKITNSVISTLEILPKEKFDEIEYEGHWGNKILRLTSEIYKKDAQALMEKILRSLSFIDKDNLLTNLEKHIDEKGNFHLRLDKQRMCKNKISLSETEGIKIKFKINKNRIILNKKSGKVDDEIYFLYRRLVISSEK